MKVLLLYYSQTGNTKQITGLIAKGVKSKGAQCDIESIKDYDTSKIHDYDLVGIGFPVFYYKEPFNVQDFIENLPNLNNQHWFIYCTHANAIGETLPLATQRLKHQNAIIIGYHDTYADTTVPFYPKPLYLQGHPDTLSLKQAEEFGKWIIEQSLRVTDPDSPYIPEPIPVSSEYFRDQAAKLTLEYISMIMPEYTVNKDKCIECGVCMEQCPVDGIDVYAEPPRIQEPCIHCWNCVNICPVLAIEADWGMMIDNAPNEFRHYRKELEDAAKRGEFRWHIDPDSIDLNNPWIKQKEKLINR